MRLTITIGLAAILFAPGIISQDEVGCFVEGECFDAQFVDQASAEDPYECLDYCQQTDGCLHFTHFSDSGACVAFADCPSFDQER